MESIPPGTPAVGKTKWPNASELWVTTQNLPGEDVEEGMLALKSLHEFQGGLLEAARVSLRACDK